ncbi:hypothetical protein [Salegentibacter mishustinae]|jgi:hypothetical protein|uniref:Chromosome partitioning protein ParA n=1 Tax=Salegentibacter mishustinae TaxID=270918 RepID=A0A0Q9Z3Z3_9FLAO|nr:hypothetical protein [Salegentibacter mishustinae]KRG27440.1 hypothetical protein APR42_10165 [Salegentibacter mishustinae]MDX1426807.1 hypothetical protein [Salegentibacter mishustinae]PNW20502.1 hypothetical protein APB85_04205 [Salegentibacter mishustinae]PZX63306.1 hypothetical protein LY54_02358 [Salegentibacter mishustinae]UBZ07897.1 hypothetical protein LDL76_04085 [Salegentibacter mishustinae]|tara:strand:+ start:277 stop:1161 length:885 start_codon:yes stop_codon:yes gene_type:complete
MMTEKKNNTALKILTGVLAVALLALGIYTIKFYNEEKENKAILTKEKEVIEDELNDLIVKYDEAIEENQIMDQNLVDARNRIERLLDSVEDNEANLVLISRYRREIGNLKAEKERLFRVVDSLNRQNQMMSQTLDSTNVVLEERTRISDSLQTTNQDLSNKVDRAAQLKITNLRGEGVIVRNSGKLVENDRTRRIDQVRTCFTITANDLAGPGERDMYVQVYNPENELVGDEIVVEHEGGAMVYSAASKVYYENNELDVCLLANTNEDKLLEGTYKVYVYANATLLGTASFNLR